MSEYPVLKNSPIVEAVIDISLKAKEDLTLDQLSALHSAIAKDYPQKKEIRRWEGKLELKQSSLPLSISTETVDGFLFFSHDKTQIFQVRLDGFTFSRLKPYESWEALYTEAYRLWQLYKAVASPTITRVALRYLNKMQLPLPIKDFSDYLTAPPPVPKSLPQGVSSFLTRVVIHDPVIDAGAIITQLVEQVVNPNFLPLILDIDVFKLKTEGISELQAWELLNNLRIFKNKIFFESITHKAKEVFL